MFIYIDNGKYITAINKKLICFFSSSIARMIFDWKLWRKLTKLNPVTIISSDNEKEIPFFRNHLPCPRILKTIRRNKWFNPPAKTDGLILHRYAWIEKQWLRNSWNKNHIFFHTYTKVQNAVKKKSDRNMVDNI